MIVSLAFALLAVPSFDLPATRATGPVSTDADDPAIWVNPRDPSRSVIIGTDKTKLPQGGLYVFNLKGQELQRIPGLDRPNNVDVEYGFVTPTGTIDIAVVTERLANRLRVYRIDDGRLSDISGNTSVFRGQVGESGEPMGIGLYRRRDGNVYAIVSPKSGPAEGYLAQYRLIPRPDGWVDTVLVRRFGRFSGRKEIESVCVDDALGFVYYGDETVGHRKYHANPDASNSNQELAVFNTEGLKGDNEGIAIWEGANRGGWLVCTDQIEGNSEYRFFPRQGPLELKAIMRGGADSTDGLDITSRNLGPEFPQGLMIGMNSGPKNFLMWDWRLVSAKLNP